MNNNKIISISQERTILKHLFSVGQNSKDICFTHYQNSGQYMIFNQEQMREQMLQWRKQRKDGALVIDPKNHRDTTIVKKQMYCLVIQDAIMSRNRLVDPMGLAFDDGKFLVSGYIYAFKHEANRDAVYKYVMGIK